MKNYFIDIAKPFEANPFIQFILYRALSSPECLLSVFLDEDLQDILRDIGLGQLHKDFHNEFKKKSNGVQNSKATETERFIPPNFFSRDDEKELMQSFFVESYMEQTHEVMGQFLDQYQLIPLNLDTSVIGQNVRALQRLTDLTDEEAIVLSFYTHYDAMPYLDKVISNVENPVTGEQRLFNMSVYTGLEQDKLIDALSGHGNLFNLGMLEHKSIYRGIHSSEYIPAFEVNSRLKVALASFQKDPSNLVKHAFRKAPETSITLNDFSHVECEELITVLKNAKDNNERGFNILIYGEPGTGKTTLAATLLAAAGLEPFMVEFETRDGESLPADKRLKQFNVGSRVLKHHSNAGLILDEASDIFNAMFPSLFSEPKISKNHITYSLDNNELPTIHLANSIERFDNALISRFDKVLRMPPLSQEQRLKTLKNAIPQEHLSTIELHNNWLHELASNEDITPRHIQNAFRYARLCNTHSDPTAFAEIVKKAIDNYLSYLPQQSKVADLPPNYNTDFINCEESTEVLVKRFASQKSLQVLFYGLPGTGKSAFAEYLLKQAGHKYKKIKVSDLLNKYVGGTEQQIAELFSNAQQQGYALILDEIDSFLRSRAVAMQSWEVTMVNQFLLEMENYKGILIATTNHTKLLDSAVFRRFSARIEFKALSEDQSRSMMLSTVNMLSLELDNQSIIDEVQQLQHLTPGDFHAVNERVDWLDIKTASGYLAALKKEVEHKQSLDEPQKVYGFVKNSDYTH